MNAKRIEEIARAHALTPAQCHEVYLAACRERGREIPSRALGPYEDLDEETRCLRLADEVLGRMRSALREIAREAAVAAMEEAYLVCQNHLCNPTCRTMGGRFCHAEIGTKIRIRAAEIREGKA